MFWDITGKATRDFILKGAGDFGGSVAERLGISWSDTSRRIQDLEAQAEQRDLMAVRTDRVESELADHQDHAREVTTGQSRNLTAGTGFDPEARQSYASVIALSGRIPV